jgi:uncharacterized protein YegP (UPF0339 family)
MASADRARGVAGTAATRLRGAAQSATRKAAALAETASQSKVASGRIGKYVLVKNADGQFHFTLHATNGQVVATSELYESRAAALNGIASVRRNAVQARLVDDSSGPESNG